MWEGGEPFWKKGFPAPPTPSSPPLPKTFDVANAETQHIFLIE